MSGSLSRTAVQSVKEEIRRDVHELGIFRSMDGYRYKGSPREKQDYDYAMIVEEYTTGIRRDKSHVKWTCTGVSSGLSCKSLQM